MRKFLFAILMMLANSVALTAQIIPTGVEYTNDTIEQGGQLLACIVTAAIVSPPAPEVVNFQLLIVLGNPGFKVTALDIDYQKQSSIAKRISDANFYTATFNHPSAFKKDITTEGQLVATLTDANLRNDFVGAFFGGKYSIRFKRTDARDERSYYIEQSPDSEVRSKFAECLREMADEAK